MTLPPEAPVRDADPPPPSAPAPMDRGSDRIAVTVVICAYTETRWTQTKAAVQSVLSQQPPPQQTLLVIDHNDALAARARREFPGLAVLDSEGEPGLSGARNTGLHAATCGITAFLDDDAVARPNWLTSLVEPYDDSRVVSTGGGVYPLWQARKPRWLPPEFYWVVGCSYRGLPDRAGAVRNPIGANMSMRTDQAIEVGGFYASVGRIGTKPRGCEETELAIRLTASQPGSAVMYVPDAAVDHHVTRHRATFGYFMRRNWHEGQSKATVVKLAGAKAGLERERRHALAVLPAAVLRDLGGFVKGDGGAIARAFATVAGFMAAVAGYVTASAGPSADGM
jgi:GT2 family glycosyltransferase